jgi:regulator of extracellular matrix RemA (YlzA/DUF370 family)
MMILGYEGRINPAEILTMQPYKGNAARRIVDAAREENRLVDMTYGNKIATVIVTKSNHVVLSARVARSLGSRWIVAMKGQFGISGDEDGEVTN